MQEPTKARRRHNKQINQRKKESLRSKKRTDVQFENKRKNPE